MTLKEQMLNVLKNNTMEEDFEKYRDIESEKRFDLF